MSRRARTAPTLKNPSLANDTIEDAALVDEIVLDSKDIARGNLRMRKGVG